ncbi:EAL domain-containing protein [Amphritea japonica]|uniref:cyclic-guanylate-specific phosphodiesterase n=1 Tax=Amphritea japonica ATCC BAA-1530 TaxID=1278309 RepID=A0A7R6PNW0_9GAMM|nr:EAL domain-containing protein [Amphritea japonica]BBB26788.1 signal transduction protein [Amphritea japonica ATCC BAA-1530]
MISSIPTNTTQLLVRHIAQTDLITGNPDTPAKSLIETMATKRIGCIVICENQCPVGIVTRRDLIKLWQDENQTAPATQFMTSPVLTISENESVDKAGLRFIADDVRHLVVTTSSGEACGIISETDVVNSHSMEHDLFLRSVMDIADLSPESINGNETVLSALQRLKESGRSALFINLNNQICGIFTERDAVNLLANSQQNDSIIELCSNTLVTIEQDLSLYNARKVFHEHQFQHLATTDNQGEITGLISYSDILNSVEHDYVYRLRELLYERDVALEQSQHNLRLADKVIEASMEAIVICDRNAKILRVNPSFTEITGYCSNEVLGKNPNILSSGRHNNEFYEQMWQSLLKKGVWQGEVWNKRKDGSVYPEWLSITAISDENGEITQYASIFSDLTEVKKSEARIKRLAYFDELTKLPNRKLFNDRLQLSLGYAREHEHRVAVAYIDVDFFQQINDLHGHEIGDKVLKEIGRRVEAQLDDGDTVARFGGDEFNLILTDVDNNPHISEFLNRLLNTISQPILIDNTELKATVSIGVSFFPTDATDAETLLKCADSAVHLAKDSGRNSLRFFSLEQHKLIHSRYQLGSDLQAAISNGEFQLYYQPKIDLNNGQSTACEALIRWLHPQLGYVSPAEFIPLAEDMGLITRIGQFVIEEACLQIAEWCKQGLETTVAINISAKQFLHADIASQILTILDHYNIPAQLLSIELTESCFLHCLEETQRGIDTLRSNGIQVAIDDFGTGYSSLSYLRNIALDILKIDRSFLVDIEKSEVDCSIVSSIIEMSHVLGLKVVAEGIESQGQLEILKSMGCDQMQGFLLARPMPAEAFSHWYLHQPDTE